ADVIERARVAGKRLHALKPNDLSVGFTDCDLKDASGRKSRQVLALGLDRERRFEHGERARRDNRIQDPDDGFRVVEAGRTREQSGHANRSRARSWALRASSSRLRGGAVVVSDSIRRWAAAVTSSTARLKTASFARDGRFDPLSFLTNCRAD